MKPVDHTELFSQAKRDDVKPPALDKLMVQYMLHLEERIRELENLNETL